MGAEIKVSTLATQCRIALQALTISGPDNARILAAVYDDIGLIEHYLLKEEKERERRSIADDSKENNQRNV